MSTTNVLPYDEDEVLIQFAQTDRSNLTEWIQQYPTQAGALARSAADKWADMAPETAVDYVAVTRVQELGLSVVRERRSTMASKAGITSLVVAAATRGLDAQAVAAKLDIPFALFFKLHRRLIAAESIPQKLIAALAETLGRQVEEVSAYLRQTPTLAAGASYRADDTPTVGEPETFAVALQDDPEVTDSQKARWLSQ
jgi:hypothetical protein